jgi:hypothetical protein
MRTLQRLNFHLKEGSHIYKPIQRRSVKSNKGKSLKVRHIYIKASQGYSRSGYIQNKSSDWNLKCYINRQILIYA